MVSFSCDRCQDVFTKRKIERHLHACRTATVSCIDCGTVFDRRTVRSHTSCITESEKYGPHRTQSHAAFCVPCQLKLNGAVHAQQHYESRKHRAKLRAQKHAANKPPSQDGTPAQQRDRREQKCHEALSASAQAPNIRGLKKVIRKLLRNAPNKTLRISTLVSQVADHAGVRSSHSLSQLVTRKVKASSRFRTLAQDVTLS